MIDLEIPQLPAGYVVRAPTDADIPAILALIDDFDRAETGEPAGYNAEDIRDDWARLDPATDAWLVVAPGGGLAAYGVLLDFGAGHLFTDCYVHPGYTGRGIGTTLARLTEGRARALVERAPAGGRVVVENNVIAKPEPLALLERQGYTLVRSFYQMRIDLDAPPAAPNWPDGIAVRAFEPGRDERAVHETVEEAFADHWGHFPTPFDQWVQRTRRPDFDPTLWWIAEASGEPAGVAFCRLRGEGGWVSTLAVRRPWRKRGLGMALLVHAFGEFYRRGRWRVGLGVDADSLTGATRLYERAGMRVVERIARYEKELRPGTGPGVQVLGE